MNARFNVLNILLATFHYRNMNSALCRYYCRGVGATVVQMQQSRWFSMYPPSSGLGSGLDQSPKTRIDPNFIQVSVSSDLELGTSGSGSSAALHPLRHVASVLSKAGLVRSLEVRGSSLVEQLTLALRANRYAGLPSPRISTNSVLCCRGHFSTVRTKEN